MEYRLSPEKEHELFLTKCAKEGLEPSKELYENFVIAAEKRMQFFNSIEFKVYEKERIRRQQRTVDQTIQEDGGIMSPIDENYYTCKRSWENHKKEHGVVEVGNEYANKRKAKK